VKDKVAYLASYQGYIGALSLTDGQFIWRKPGSVYKNMVLSSNTLYLTDSNDVVWSLDKRTGHVNWKQTGLKARGLTEPVLIGQDLVVGDKTGYLHFIGSQTGELIGRSQLSGGVTMSPSVIGRNLYVLTDNGMLNQLSVS
jgi:outer membrane protein assembly factor BamB